MSNIIKTIQYLKDNAKRFIRITNSQTNAKIGLPDIYLKDIPNEDLASYIKTNLGPITQPTYVYVELRFEDGNTSRKKDGYPLEIQPEVQQQHFPVMQTPAPAPVSYPAVMPHTPMDYGQNNGLGFGLGLPAIMEMNRKADRLSDKEEQLSELKDEHKELKHENKKLDIENRELKTKLSTAEAQKDMAIMMAKLENKSFFDSPAFEKVMDQAPQLLAGIAAMKGVPMAATGALGSPNLSDSHNQLIELISESLNENQVNYLGSICHLMDNQAFSLELKNLITKYATV